MSTKDQLTPTLADAFDVGRKEGLKEAFAEILELTSSTSLKQYLQARLKSIKDFENKNPFKTKDQT